MPQETTDDLMAEIGTPRVPAGVLALIFGFGLAAGFLAAFAGLGFLEDSASVIAGAFLVALVAVLLVGATIYLLRRRIMDRLFGIAEAQVELFAGPLTAVAEGAANRDPEQAVQSARRLIRLALARYAWLATRRWLITSLTALIAAMAALAGTALLFKQNALIAQQSELLAEQNVLVDRQSELLSEQNDKLREQTLLLSQDVQLAEAARNAGLAVEVTAIAAELGALADAVAESIGPTGVQGAAARVPLIDPARDLGRGLMMRIVAASQAIRPYRFLETGLTPADPADRLRMAMEGRRGDLPVAWSSLAASNGWAEHDAGVRLTDRPGSPERGQILRVLVNSGLRELPLLNYFGLDLSFAHAPALTLPGVTLDHANLSYADLSWADLVQVTASGAVLDNARFAHAAILRSDFSSVAGPAARAPYTEPGMVFNTSLNGADFSGALIRETGFRGVNALAGVFDGAALIDVDFSDASLGAATMRGAVLAGVRFDRAYLNSVDLDGAIVFGADPLAELAAAAHPGSFRADRFRADPVDKAEVLETGRLADLPDATQAIAGVADMQAWRLVRVQAFENMATPD